jgi:hypothetical protein
LLRIVVEEASPRGNSASLLAWHTTVQQLESLRRGAYPQTMQKLATALGVAPEELLHEGNTQR